MEAAPDADLAGRVVEELRRTCEFCPAPATIFKVAEALRPPVATPSWPPPFRGFPVCPLSECDGSGWVVAETVVGEAVERCCCYGMPREFQRAPQRAPDRQTQETVEEIVASVAIPEPPARPVGSITRQEVEEARSAELERRKGSGAA